MIDALPNVLGSPSNSYSVFEANQVLASDQLNSIASYVIFQERLTRARLLGVGIMGGLHVTLAGKSIQVGHGAGITTDGDLLTLAAATTYDKFKKYGPSAPRYAPFYVGDTMRSVFELVPQDQADATSQPLADFPGNLSEMVVVMLMERYADDPDLCTGPDCDNLGKTAIDAPRVLLVSRADADDLSTSLKTLRDAALTLPIVDPVRPTFAPTLATTNELVKTVRDACRATHSALLDALATLPATLPDFTQQVFGGDPTPEWRKRLIAQLKGDDEKDGLRTQYFYDHLKDVAETWNALRETMSDDDRVLCPDINAFPRHLLLGDLTNPRERRTAWFPSPLTSGNRELTDHARFLARKLDAQIRLFSVPANSPGIRVTPSYSEAVCLEERAIPYYYPAAIGDLWSYRKARRRETVGLPGYHTSRPGVFGRQVGRFDFFRIEGHIGTIVTKAKEEIERAIADNNLPFTVRAVLIHNDRRKILVRPEIRYGDLHRLHQLLRKELTVQLSETKTFNDRLKVDLAAAEQDATIRPNVTGSPNLLGQVNDAANEAAQTLARARFTEYVEARKSLDWRGGFKRVVSAATSMKANVGDVTRNNYASAFDSLLTNNHPAWLEWLESLIQSKNDQEDDKLLFPRFCEQHPSLEHFGGSPRGGTFVLIYDDQGRVVADFTLPYDWRETAEPEPPEPEPLTEPNYKDRALLESSIKLIPRLDLTFDQRFQRFEDNLKGNLLKDQFDSQNKQLDYLKQFVQTLGAKPAVVRELTDPNREIADPLLRSLVDELDYKKRLVEDLRNVVVDPATPVDLRKRTQTELDRVELDLADSIRRSATFIADANVKVEPGSDGSKAVLAIANSVEKVGGVKAQTVLREVSAGTRIPQIKQVFTLRGM